MDVDQWSLLVRQALQSYYDQKTSGQPRAVAGAPLKPMIVELAVKAGLPYPPPAYANKKFGELLQALPTAVITRHRLGQDLLVAPAGREDLFDAQSESSVASRSRVFRADVFKAFTKIPNDPDKAFWYSKKARVFIEQSTAASDDDLVRVDTETMQGALETRKQFVTALGVARESDSSLLRAINTTDDPLGAFARAIKQLHMEKRWHDFRAQKVLEKLRLWATQNDVPYEREWEATDQAAQTQKISARETNAFLAGLMQLGPEDAKRVLVPLDIVLKVLRRD